MPQIGNNFKYSGRKPLDDRQLCDSLEILQENANNILYPPGFKVYCIKENKEYQNIAKLNEIPVWVEYNTKAYVFQSDEPSNINMLWIKEDEAVELSGGQYNVDDLMDMIKTYKSIMDSLVTIVTALQKDVEYIKAHGTIIGDDTNNIEGAILTDDEKYLITDDGKYLII